MPNVSSNLRHSDISSGAELEVMKRRVGAAFLPRAASRFTSMLRIVGLPAAIVAPLSFTQSKKRLAENFRASNSVAPFATGPSADSTCADIQFMER